MIFSHQKISLQYWINKLFQPQEESPDYHAWKQKLFRDRLRSCFWILLSCWIAFAIKDFVEVYDAKYSEAVIKNLGRDRLKFYRDITIYPYSTIAIAWCMFGYRLRKDNFRCHTNLIFLCLAWSLTLFPLVVGTFIGEPYIEDVDTWGLVFLILAILIPVNWRIHLIAQLGLIAYYIGVIPLLGLLDLIKVDIFRVFEADTLVPLLLVCPTSIVAISMYERLQQKEFESRRELKVFLHSVTHDLRTPVMASSIVLENLLQQPGDKLTVDRSVLERLYQGSDRTFKIVNSLIEAHNTEINGVVTTPRSCRIDDLVDSVLIDLQPILLEHQAIVDNRMANNLPHIKADSTQLWRVLNNLINNALKHNPNYVRITIDAVVEQDCLYCTISDDGVGISTEQCDRLFKLYSRGKRSRYMPGLGIGLYLSQQIIMAHGGEIGVVSSLGNGSTFWFTLPYQPE